MFSDDYDMKIPKEKNVKYEKAKNLTPRKIKAKGIKKAYEDDVEFVCFVDSDDFMNPKRIEILKKYFIRNNVDILIHNLNTVDVNGNIINENIFEFDKEYTNRFYWEKNNSGFGNTVYKTNLIYNLLPFPKNTFSLDWEVIFMLSLENDIFTLDKSLLNYRQHRSNVTGINKKLNKKQMIDFLKKRSLHYEALKKRYYNNRKTYAILDYLYEKNNEIVIEANSDMNSFLRKYNKKSDELIWWELP